MLTYALQDLNIAHKNHLDISEYDAVFTIGTLLLHEDERFLKLLEKPHVFFSPIEDFKYQADTFIKYEVGTEEGVLNMLIYYFCAGELMQNYADKLDMGYISAECSVSEEEIEDLQDNFKDKKIALILSYDLEHHPLSNNIAKLLSLLSLNGFFDVIIPFSKKPIAKGDLHYPSLNELESYNGAVVYAMPFLDEDKIFTSKQFLMANRLNEGDKVEIDMSFTKITKEVKSLANLKGTIALVPVKSHEHYRYEIVKIKRI